MTQKKYTKKTATKNTPKKLTQNPGNNKHQNLGNHNTKLNEHKIQNKPPKIKKEGGSNEINKSEKDKLPEIAQIAQQKLVLYGWHVVKAALLNPQRKKYALFATENVIEQIRQDENLTGGGVREGVREGGGVRDGAGGGDSAGGGDEKGVREAGKNEASGGGGEGNKPGENGAGGYSENGMGGLPEIVCLNRLQMNRLTTPLQKKQAQKKYTKNKQAKNKYAKHHQTELAIHATHAVHAVHQNIALATEPLQQIFLEDLLAKLDAQEWARLLVLDQVTDPQNVGAVLRSALAFNVQAVITTERNAPDETAALAKAAAGALESVPLVKIVNLARGLNEIKKHGFTLVGLDNNVKSGDGTRGEGEADGGLKKCASIDKLCLMLGAEGAGMRRLSKEACHKIISIPINPKSESLNIAAATAIALYATQSGGT